MDTEPDKVIFMEGISICSHIAEDINSLLGAVKMGAAFLIFLLVKTMY